MIAWWDSNYPASISTSSEEVQFWYGPHRQRWKEIYTSSAGTETTYHADKLLEKVATASNTDYRHHYIYAGNELLGIYSRTTAGTNTMYYVLGDHQGGIDKIDTGANPSSTYVNESFTPFGNRRNGETWSGAPPTADETAINAVSRRGYTGATVLGVSMGLNHFNGRVEDAITGRFLSPDPILQDPGNTQSFNRYSYVNNNPLTYTDPTGFDEESPIPEEVAPSGGSGGGGDLDDIVVEAARNSGGVATNYAPGNYAINAPNGDIIELVSVGSAGRQNATKNSSPTVPSLVSPPKPSLSPAQGPPHKYVVGTITNCSAGASFAAVKSPGGTAPGAPQAQDGFNPRIDLAAFSNLWDPTASNPISQNVNSSALKITNTTLDGHVFYPGDVNIQVSPLGPSSSSITYTGTGNSSWPIANDIVGVLYFTLVNALTTLGCAYSSGLGGGPAP